MDIRDMLKSFYRCLVREAAIKALICGAIAGFGVGALIMGASWLATATPEAMVFLPAFNGTWIAVGTSIGITVLLAGILYFAVFRPTLRDAARRVDALGLEERTITMLSMEGSGQGLEELQRADTAAALGRLPHNRLKLSIFKIPAAIACVALLALSLTVIVPNAQGLYEPLAPARTEQEILDGLIEDLRAEIENAEHVRDEIKDQLHEMVDRLEEELGRLEATEDKMNAIRDTANRIHELLDKEQTRHQLGEALKEFENTKELGDAIQKGDSQDIDQALESIRDKIEAAENNGEMSDELKDLAASIDKAVDKAGREDDPLTNALKNLSSQLKEAAKDSEENKKEDASNKTDEAIENARDQINEAIGDQKDQADLDENLQDTIKDALEELKPEGSPSVGEGGDGISGSNGNGQEPPKEDTPPSTDNKGQGNGPEDPSGSGVHDPEYDLYGNSFKDGKTPYTEEFDLYFKQEMARLEGADLTDEEKERIARYFASMMVEQKDEGAAKTQGS